MVLARWSIAALDAPYERQSWNALMDAWDETWTIDPGFFSAISFRANVWLMMTADLRLVFITLECTN